MRWSRRDFLRTLLGAVGLGAAAACGRKREPETRWLTLGFAMTYDLWEPTTAPGPKTWPDRKPLYEDPHLFVMRTEDGFRVYSSKCTHRGCELKWSKGRFRCPCHGSEFKRDGSVAKGPAKDPLVQLKYRIEEDQLLVLAPLAK